MGVIAHEQGTMFSQTVEYALRAVVFLADQKKACTTPQIAEVTKVPAPYLAKVLQSLSRGGLVKSQRGLHGGFTLALDPSQITIRRCLDAGAQGVHWLVMPAGDHKATWRQV